MILSQLEHILKIFCVSFIFSYGLVSGFISWRKKSYFSGFFGIMVLSVIFWGITGRINTNVFSSGGVILLMALTGFWYDKKKIHRLFFFIVHLCLISLLIHLNNLHFPLGNSSSGFISIIGSFFWMFGISYSIYMVNSFNGLALGICVIHVITYISSLLLAKTGNIFVLECAGILAGYLLVLLRFDYIPSKIKIGYAHLFPLSAILGMLSLKNIPVPVAMLGGLLPLFIFFVPVFIISYLIFLTYIKGPIVNCGEIKDFFWKVTEKRIVVFVYVIYILVNLQVLSFIYFTDKVFLGVIIGSLTIIAYFGKINFSISHSKFSEIPAPKDRINILGVEIDNITMENAVFKAEKIIDAGKPSYVVTPDTLAIERAQWNKEYLDIVNQAAMNIPDGIGLLWASDFLGTPIKERVPGIDFTIELCKLSERKGYSIYLFGAAPGIVEMASLNLKETYPELKIVGSHNGFFDEEEEKKIITEIQTLKPDILLVALGAPRQEMWIYENREILNVPLSLGIGGSFDVISGTKQRASNWIQKMGMEWLFRLMQEPFRVSRMLKLPVFVGHVLKFKIKHSA